MDCVVPGSLACSSDRSRSTPSSTARSWPAARPCSRSTGSASPVLPASSPTSATSQGSPTGTGSPPGPAPHPWTHPQQNRSATGSPAPATRRLNHVLHIAAIVQLRNDTEGRVYYRRKLAAGKTPLEALRCLKRRLSDVIFRRPVADAREREVSGQGTGPGGHRGATQQSSAVDLPPPIDTSDQPLPGPAEPTLRPTPHPRNPDSDRTLEPIP
jgi:hypothetical protein